MRTLRLLLAISTITLALGCSDDEREQIPREFTVEPYTQVWVDGQITVHFNTFNSLPNGYTVQVLAPGNFQQMITVENVNGVLVITAEDDIVLSDGIIIELNTLFLDEIRLERDQIAEFIGVFDQESLRVVTEANSELTLSGFRIDRLDAKLEGESVLNLSTWYGPYSGDLTFPEEAGLLIDEYTLLLDDSRVIVGDNIVLSDTAPFEWIISGGDIREYFVMEYADFKTEGNTTLNAEEAPVEDIYIKLEGSSQASVWALDRISGKGEGSSVLYYRGFPDISYYVTQGDAQIIPIN